MLPFFSLLPPLPLPLQSHLVSRRRQKEKYVTKKDQDGSDENVVAVCNRVVVGLRRLREQALQDHSAQGARKHNGQDHL
jgi:hypothetical protein